MLNLNITAIQLVSHRKQSCTFQVEQPVLGNTHFFVLGII
jgi:hypothetical protein